MSHLPVVQTTISYEELNNTELLELIRKKYGVRLRRSLPNTRLIYLLESGDKPLVEELAGTKESRQELELWVTKHWEKINSQLPCKGESRGKCTIYPCSEIRHLACYLNASPHLSI